MSLNLEVITLNPNLYNQILCVVVTTPLWGKCEVATHTPENGTWESSRTPKNSEVDCKG
jgi:hypothetical protein